MGHIHNAQKIGRETVRYSGCPLYYDFSEINRNKGLTLVTIRSKDDIATEQIEIPILHRLLQKTGTLEELLAAGAGLEDKDQYFIQCILNDKHVPPRALEQLRDVYGEPLINVKRSITESASTGPASARGRDSVSLSIEEQFSLFYQEQQDELLDGDQEALVRIILEQQARQSGDYISDVKSVPREDSQELLEHLLRAIGEGNE